MAPMVRRLEELVAQLDGGRQSAASLDAAAIGAVVARICDECTDDDNNRIALSACGGLQPLVSLSLSVSVAGSLARSPSSLWLVRTLSFFLFNLALSDCVSAGAQVELTLSDVGGAARTALNTAMKELARNSDLKERIMQLLLDARTRAAQADEARGAEAAAPPPPQPVAPNRYIDSSSAFADGGVRSASIDRGPLQGLTIDSVVGSCSVIVHHAISSISM